MRFILVLSAFCGVRVYAVDKDKIVFAGDSTGNYEIYLMNPDGSELIRLTDRAW